MAVVGHLDAEQIEHPGAPRIGKVLRIEGALDELLLELEAQDDVEAVRRLVGLDADEPGLGAVDRGEERLEVDVSELRRERLLQRLVPVEPERAAAARRGSPRYGSATRSVRATARSRAACARAKARSRARSGRGPASCIVDQSESRPGLVVARRQAHVARRERGAERVHGRVEAIRAVLEAERREDALAERSPAASAGNGWSRNDASTRGASRTSSASTGRIVPKTSATSVVFMNGSKSSRSGGIGRVVPLEALDVAPLQLEVALERREEVREVVVRARVDPDLVPERRRSRHLDAELGRDAALLLPVAPGDADEAGVVRVVLERLFDGRRRSRSARPRRRRTSRGRCGRASPAPRLAPDGRRAAS